MNYPFSFDQAGKLEMKNHNLRENEIVNFYHVKVVKRFQHSKELLFGIYFINGTIMCDQLRQLWVLYNPYNGLMTL